MIIFVSCVLLLSLSLYALLGGADFGGGLWDLIAGGDRRGAAPRKLIDESITPVWEANHMWVIFALVLFWTIFPRGFADVMTAAALPIWLAVFGIVLRGAGFAFRKEVQTVRWQRLLGAVFAFSSLVTPFFLGTVIGAVVAGTISASARDSDIATWTSATSLLMGFLFVAVCAYMAAIFPPTRRSDETTSVSSGNLRGARWPRPPSRGRSRSRHSSKCEVATRFFTTT